jgi:hypothetical protein
MKLRNLVPQTLLKNLKISGAIVLILAESILPNSSFASLPSQGGDEVGVVNSPFENARVVSAILFDDGKPVCQISTLNRPDLLPHGLKSGSEKLAGQAQANLPSCGPEQTAVLEFTSANGTLDTRTALVPGVAAVAIFCFATAAGGAILSLYVDYKQELLGHRPKLSSELTNNVAGAAGTSVAIGIGSELSSGGFGASSAAAIGVVTGVAVVCGLAGGLGTYAVKYIFSK